MASLANHFVCLFKVCIIGTFYEILLNFSQLQLKILYFLSTQTIYLALLTRMHFSEHMY